MAADPSQGFLGRMMSKKKMPGGIQKKMPGGMQVPVKKKMPGGIQTPGVPAIGVGRGIRARPKTIPQAPSAAPRRGGIFRNILRSVGRGGGVIGGL
jgi:hypothetical protein